MEEMNYLILRQENVPVTARPLSYLACIDPCCLDIVANEGNLQNEKIQNIKNK